MEEVKEVLVIKNIRVVYEAHWVGIDGDRIAYDNFDIGTHEIECKHMPARMQLDIKAFIRNVEIAHDEAETDE